MLLKLLSDNANLCCQLADLCFVRVIQSLY